MNAIITVKDSISKLNRQEKRTIIFVAKRPSDPLPVRADRLKELSFCTDEVKFQVLKESDVISKDLCDCLFNIYFGIAEPENEEIQPERSDQTSKEFISVEPKQLTAQEETAEPILNGFDVYEPKEKKKRMVWTDESITDLINSYRSGMSGKAMADKFGVNLNSIKNTLHRAKNNEKYKGMFETENKNTPTLAEASQNAANALKAIGEELSPINSDMKEYSPKAFTAVGRGFLTTDGGLKINEEPITKMLRQKIIEEGVVQFYAQVEITVRPVVPAGMIVKVEG